MPLRAVVPLRQRVVRFFTLWRAMTRRNLAARYRGSLLGVAWVVLTPFLMMVLYTTVFSGFLRVRLSDNSGPTAFALYLLAGLLPWSAFAEAAGRAPQVMIEHRTLVTKVVFPLEIVPLSLVSTALVNHAIAMGLFLIGALVFKGWALSLLLLPLLIVPLALLATGVTLLLASLGVFLRDTGQASGLALTVWLFLTPILYLPSAVPERFRFLVRLNPFTPLVASYRRVILDGRAPALVDLIVLYLWAIGIAALGWWWFDRTKASFADVL
jgi:lipopolysaccharide transport system permease protein